MKRWTLLLLAVVALSFVTAEAQAGPFGWRARRRAAVVAPVAPIVPGPVVRWSGPGAYWYGPRVAVPVPAPSFRYSVSPYGGSYSIPGFSFSFGN